MNETIHERVERTARERQGRREETKRRGLEAEAERLADPEHPQHPVRRTSPHAGAGRVA
jgi:hypothetical protein